MVKNIFILCSIELYKFLIEQIYFYKKQNRAVIKDPQRKAVFGETSCICIQFS